MRRLIVTLFVITTACGGAFRGYAAVGANRQFALSRSRNEMAIDELARRFYADTIEPAAMRSEIERALARAPAHATLHEMAAHLAELRGDDEARWAHWLSAAADTRAPFTTIYLNRALSRNMTVAQQNASILLLEQMRRDHPSAEARFVASRRLIGLLEAREDLSGADAVAEELRVLSRWQVIGAFDNDQGRGFSAPYPPEERPVDLNARYRGMRDEVSWRPATLRDRLGNVRIGEVVAPSSWAVAYLVTHVRAPQARSAQLRMSIANGTKAWLNGQLVVDQERLGHGATDNVVIDVQLRAGWNRLLVKSAQDDSGSWRMSARLSDEHGETIALEEDDQLHDFGAPATGELPANVSPAAEAIAAVEPPLRRVLLTHHDASRNGFEGDALADARTLLETAPHHPVVLYHAAMTHWTNDELGETMDLLNEGATRFADRAGFLWLRGAFYRERDRYDRAIEDLERAMELEPNARLAAMELAGTYDDRNWSEHECRTVDRVLVRHDDSAWAHRVRGVCAQDRGYRAEAREYYLRALALQPGNGWGLRRLSLLARWREDHEAAIGYARRLVAVHPWASSSRLLLADQLRFSGRRAEAREEYARLTEVNPDWSTPHRRLGTMAFEDGDDATALASWVEALARDPDDGALADRVDALRPAGEDPDRALMPGDDEIERALAAASELTIHPGAHTVLLLDDEVTTVQQDGSANRRITQVHLAVTTDGRDELIRTRVPPNARILQAFSVAPDGARQEASSIRGGTVRFRGLDAGSRVVLQYIFHSAPPTFLPNHFVSSWVFQGTHRQLGVARWLVQVPAGRELAMHIQGAVEHTVQTGEERDTHLFMAANVPPFVPEPSAPALRDLIAMVTLSTLTDWQQYVDWERALLSEVFESNAQLRRLAAQLTEGASTPRERLDRIYRYASREIRYQQDYEETIAGVRPHSCPVVLERGYGDCKDKAVLMILLAREVGIDLRFTVLRTTRAGRVLRDVPNQQFNHAIVYVPRQDGIEAGFFMDPTTDGLDMGNLRPDDQGATALVLDPDDGSWAFEDIPYQSADMTYFRCELGVDVAGEERASARAECRVRGSTASRLRRLMRNHERATQVRQGIATTMFGGATVTDASEEHVEDIDHPLELRLELDVSTALQTQGRDRRLPVPSPFTLGNATRLESRRLPLRLGPPSSSRWEVRVSAPPGGRIVRAPQSFSVEHPCFSVTRRSSVRGRVATITLETEVTCSEVSSEDYPELRRQAQRAATQLNGSEVILRP